MAKRKTILTVLWVIIAAIAAASVIALIIFLSGRILFRGDGWFSHPESAIVYVFHQKNFKD